MNHESQEQAPQSRDDDGHEKNEDRQRGSIPPFQDRIEHPLRELHVWFLSEICVQSRDYDCRKLRVWI